MIQDDYEQQTHLKKKKSDYSKALSPSASLKITTYIIIV